MFFHQVKRVLLFQRSIVRPSQAQFSSTALQRHEFFVVVWNKPGAKQVPMSRPKQTEPFQSFAGDILDAASSGKTRNAVRGSSFVYEGTSVEDMARKLSKDPRVKEGIWDISTAMITPFETVLTSDFEVESGQAQVE